MISGIFLVLSHSYNPECFLLPKVVKVSCPESHIPSQPCLKYTHCHSLQEGAKLLFHICDESSNTAENQGDSFWQIRGSFTPLKLCRFCYSAVHDNLLLWLLRSRQSLRTCLPIKKVMFANRNRYVILVWGFKLAKMDCNLNHSLLIFSLVFSGRTCGNSSKLH